MNDDVMTIMHDIVMTVMLDPELTVFMYLQEKTLVALAPQTFHPEDSFDLMD